MNLQRAKCAVPKHAETLSGKCYGQIIGRWHLDDTRIAGRVASGSAGGRVVDAVVFWQCSLAGLADRGVIEGLAGFQGDAVAVGDEAARNS